MVEDILVFRHVVELLGGQNHANVNPAIEQGHQFHEERSRGNHVGIHNAENLPQGNLVRFHADIDVVLKRVVDVLGLPVGLGVGFLRLPLLVKDRVAVAVPHLHVLFLATRHVDDGGGVELLDPGFFLG